jgi:hypothetical protein
LGDTLEDAAGDALTTIQAAAEARVDLRLW